MREGGYHENMNRSTQGLVGLAPRRKVAGYTQETFSLALGVNRSLLAAWEVGRVWPSARWLPEMAELLGCPIGELFVPPEDTSIVTTEEEENHAGRVQESLL